MIMRSTFSPALQLAKLSGFNPIITTASTRNEDYCRAAGATHVIDYRTTPYASIPAVVREIVKGPVSIIFDAISTQQSQQADWEILEPNGSLAVVLPIAIDMPAEPKDNRWAVLVYGEVRGQGNSEFGKPMYAALPGLLADGLIKVRHLYVLPRGWG
jgi:NADPH:quinone reductase-like Zn-dependent oxidoreductase